MSAEENCAKDMSSLVLNVDPEQFLGDVAVTLIAELEETVGVVEAATFVSHVGDQLGDRYSQQYGAALGELPAASSEIAEVLVDLERRIGGCFEVESADDRRIILMATRCPFGARANGHPSLCMMTTSVMGRIVADALGFARIHTAQSIATGHESCRVVIDLEVPDTAAGEVKGYEFYG